jgi:Ti-type conjugative transfer relaxase TraA
MNPRLNTGKGVSGAIRYVLGQGREAQTGALKPAAANDDSRVAWMSGTGFGFAIKNAADAELARRVMEFDSLNQGSRTRLCEKDCVHLSLAWRPGEAPTQAEMEEAARGALASLGMANAKALFVAHNDEDYAHVHIVASKINPATGRAYDLAASWRTLSTWAEGYEREHGGVVSARRQDMNELRQAIAERDAGAVLEALTKQRSTFTADQLDRALQKEMQVARGATREQKQGVEAARTQFAGEILARPELVKLADRPSGPVTRYTTRAVLEAENQVLQAARELAVSNAHHIDDGQRAALLGGARYAAITEEQARAFRHVTGAEGIALIDGQAGTGKSFTVAAVRETYEAAGRRVIGLGPTNAVAQDMKADGFGHAATIHSELFALNNGRRSWDAKTVVIVDEAAMLDTKLMAMVTAHAAAAGAKLILVGDDRQLSSIDRGGMFGALKDRHGAAELSQVKRQHKNDERRAAEMMAEGNFHDALNIYDQKGAIHWTRTQGEARDALLDQWAKDSAASPDRTRFVFAYTNADVATLNAGLRAVRKGRGELGEDHELDTAHGRFAFAFGDRIQFTATDKKAGIVNGAAGTIEKIVGTEITMTLDGRKPVTITFNAATFDKFRHGYAGTIYRGQGRTLDQTYLYHSEHWRSAASYVALTRHRDKAELFVARNTARDVKELARQMARTDERRAASQFYYAPEITAAPLTPAELHARFSAEAIPPKDQTMQPKDGTAQAANQNAREQLDELAAQQAASVRPAEPEPGRYDNLRLAADFRRAEYEAADAGAGRISAAWKQPAFTHDTIRLDPWTAVYLPIPPDAERSLFGRELLRDARVVARDLQMATDGLENPTGGWLEKWASGPAVNRESTTREENWAAAAVRVAEIEARLEIATEARQAPEVAAAASSATIEPASPASGPQRTAEPYIHDESEPASVGPAPPGEIRLLRGLRYFFERTGDHLAAAIQHFADMLAPPPKLTAGQVHDRLQAAGNLETLHAAAVAEAQQAHEAEKDEQIFRADQQQQQANLSFAERYGLPPTSEAVLGREHGPEPDEELEP